MDLGTFKHPIPRFAGATLVAESGVEMPEDSRRLRNAGADAVLVGEAVMRATRRSSRSSVRWSNKRVRLLLSSLLAVLAARWTKLRCGVDT